MGPMLAIHCYSGKQPFASRLADSEPMSKKGVNEVLAENLAYFMKDRGLSQTALS